MRWEKGRLKFIQWEEHDFGGSYRAYIPITMKIQVQRPDLPRHWEYSGVPGTWRPL